MTTKTYAELLNELDSYNARTKAATETYESNLGSIQDGVDAAEGFANDSEASAIRAEEAVEGIDITSIARSLNVLDSEVIYSTDTTTLLDDVLYIYDSSSQVVHKLPYNVGAGEKILSISSNELTTTGGFYYMEVPSDGFEINVQDWGAKPDNGTTDNNPVFLRIVDFIHANGGNCKIVFPPSDGEYVYYQYKRSIDTSFYGLSGSFVLTGIRGVLFEFNGAKIKLADGTHFGSFDPITGVASTTIQTGAEYANGGGWFIWLTDCSDIVINDLNWDGNVSNHIIGGEFGDTGYQISEYGILIHGLSENISVNNCVTSHSGLDGIAVGVTWPVHYNPNIKFTNHTSKFNGRQGLSLVGGSNMTFDSCTFSDTGRDTIASLPRSGIDIEPEMGPTWGNLFLNCLSSNNVGPALLTADNPDNIRDNRWESGKLVGTTATSLFIPTGGDIRPPISFYNATIKGASEQSGGWYFNCNFDDIETTDYPDIYTSNFFFDGWRSNTRQEDCQYIITQSSSGGLWSNAGGTARAKVYPSWDSDTHTGSVLGVVGTIAGDITIYDRTTGSTPRQIGSSVSVGLGVISVKDNSGNIIEKTSASTRPGNISYAEQGRPVTSVMITANESVDVGTGFGATRITAIFSNSAPTSGEYLDGDIIYKYQFTPGSLLGWVCTTSGTAGSTAVFKSFGQIEA